MPLSTYKISEYDHIAESEQFEKIRTFLEQVYGDSNKNCVLIGNYNIEGVELDALMINAGGFRILEFKNWGGKIVARENGSWTSDGMTIEGGAGRKSPYDQIRLNKSRVTKGLNARLGVQPQLISAHIIFWQEAEIDTSQLSDTVKHWLSVGDNAHISTILDGMETEVLSEDAILQIPSILHIEDFSADEINDNYQFEEYDYETATNFFTEIADALNKLPDYKQVYRIFYDVFEKCLNQKTEDIRINFAGTFAKTDYLLKEYQANRDMMRATNDTRVRLKKASKMQKSQLEHWCRQDLKNLCEFIAFIYNTSVPSALTALFPEEEEHSSAPVLIEENLRVIVEKWEDKFVFVQCDESTDGETLKVCYAYGNKFYDYDWTYLNTMFYKGAQLNLIRPRHDDGIIYPELIIFEPDYLVDITAIARCFTNYAESPFVNLIHKIEPSTTTDAILLGNFAGQLLDEEIHHLPNTRSYAESVKKFMKDNAISIMELKNSPDFHHDAQVQKQHIYDALHVQLPALVRNFDSREGIVEPSFFSELLGVQGRMDYLQLDFKVLLEQKSGKGEFPFDNFVHPRQKEEHYVQILLYMALIRYNYREIYERIKNDFFAFLLYSKYSQSLLSLSFAPELLFRAIKVRNGIAWTEMLYTRTDGLRILGDLTPEKLNKKHTNDNLWTRWQYQQIADLLSPIHEASDLERAYYFRFLTFIANEHVLSKLGNKTKEDSGFASKWHETLEEKQAAGNIYDNLTLILPENEDGESIKTVTLKFPDTIDNDMSNFRVGDIVVLYPYDADETPDIRKTMVFRSTIAELKTDKITLRLRAPQSDNRVFRHEKDKVWAIEHDFMESSYKSLYTGMHAFLSAPKARRDLLMLQREPLIDYSKRLNGDYGDFNEMALHVKQAQELFLIIGPPGTGKTSYGLMSTLREELSETNSSVLLVSYTNRAVDEICCKLHDAGIDFIRIGGDLSCSDTYRANLLSEQIPNCRNIDELKQKIEEARVIVGTTTTMNSNLSLLKHKHFTLAIVDEASQILEPHLMGLLSASTEGVPTIKKLVLIGDQKQLPAVVQQKPEVSKVDDAILRRIHLTDCRASLFERLLKEYEHNAGVTFMLRKQGRMHEDIALFPNYTFYNNRLALAKPDEQRAPLPRVGNGSDGITDMLRTRRIAFIATKLPENPISDKANQNEADVIAATVVKIYELEKDVFDKDRTVGVIVPYRNQIATVRNTIARYGISELDDITIDTVERYQGSQRRYIIYGFTIQKYFQLKFLASNGYEDSYGCLVDRKLNVAMTRAEEHLILVGNPELLANNITFFKLMEFVRSRHGFFDVSVEDYIHGRFEVPQYDDKELNLSEAIFTTTPEFNHAFEKFVTGPIKEASGTQWPEKIFGYDMPTNLNAIGYGRINFSNQLSMFDDISLSPERQVLIYCHYIMRQYYCSSMSLYQSCKNWLLPQIESVDGRVQMIDIGCGPATCGIAFAEQFLDYAPNLVYTGIDISVEMKRMGNRLLDGVTHGRLYHQMKESFDELDDDFWNGCSECPSLCVFNISYFFSNVSAKTAERLALKICDVMRRYPMNRYVFFIQHSAFDSRLNSYLVFRDILQDCVHVLRHEKSSLSYQLNSKQQYLPFCYDIFEKK